MHEGLFCRREIVDRGLFYTLLGRCPDWGCVHHVQLFVESVFQAGIQAEQSYVLRVASKRSAPSVKRLRVPLNRSVLPRKRLLDVGIQQAARWWPSSSCTECGQVHCRWQHERWRSLDGPRTADFVWMTPSVTPVPE